MALKNIFENTISTSLDAAAKLSALKSFDCIIVGGGTAGIIFATELAKNTALNVLLVEAGDLELQTHINNSVIRFNAPMAQALQSGLEYFPKNDDGSNFGFLISCLGGRSLFWGASAPRFRDYSFDNWPLKYGDLTTYYQTAEDAFNVSDRYGNSSITQMFCRLLQTKGIGALPGPFALDTDLNQNGILGGTIANALNILFRSEVLNNNPKNLYICTSAFTQNVLISADHFAKGILVNDFDHNTYEIYSKSVVLAAGAFESTRIALSSQIKNDNDLLGKFITEHIFCRAYFPMPLAYYSSKPEVAIIIIPGTDKDNSQIEMQLPAHRLLSVRNEKDWSPSDTTDYSVMMRSFGSIESRASNFIELTDSTAPAGFKVHMQYSNVDNALATSMIAKMEVVKQILGFSDAPVTQLPKGSSNHEAGGLIMGDAPDNSVTDKFGRFHSVENLISADAANFPSISCANPHLTIAAVAYYKATYLLKYLKQHAI